MKNWEKALHKFLEKYQSKAEFEGALLCGSYATGNQNKFSDIDVHILISDKQNWRERGVASVEGYLVEYFINPPKKIRQEFREDYLNGGNACANMFAYGIILSDKNGCVKKLQSEALEILKKHPRKWTAKELSMDLYGIWNLKDELNSLISEKKSFNAVYYELLKALQDVYFKVKGIPKISFTKAERLLSDPEFARKYHVQKLPDKKFTQLLLSALHETDVLKIQKLYDFVLSAVGGFDITDFKIKATLDNKKHS